MNIGCQDLWKCCCCQEHWNIVELKINVNCVKIHLNNWPSARTSWTTWPRVSVMWPICFSFPLICFILEIKSTWLYLSKKYHGLLLSELYTILELFAWLTINVVSGTLIWAFTHTENKPSSDSLVLLQNIYYAGFVVECVLSTPECCLALYAFCFFLFWYQSSLRNSFTDKSFLPKMAFVWGPVRILAPLPQRSPVESRNIWLCASSGGHVYQKSDLGDFMSAFIPLLLLFLKKCLMDLW